MKSEKKSAEHTTGTRRQFLLGATLGSAGAVAAIVTGGGAKEVLQVAALAPEKKKVMGYHETDHIRRYYETTRL